MQRAAQLQVIWRVGEDHVDAGCGKGPHERDAIPDQQTIALAELVGLGGGHTGGLMGLGHGAGL